MTNQFTTYLTTPVGPLRITGTTLSITSVHFTEEVEKHSEIIPDVLVQCKKELEEYFSGTRKLFTVPLLATGTAFEQEVWKQLQQIAFGKTLSYGEIAKRMNKSAGSSRAVGHANAKNPIAIVIPCHRVIGETGKLTGYAGGLWRKDWLLQHEAKISGKELSLF
ncbi:MAG: methylated-DNA--[protein]-cysteine S-methyltransferase [Chitinophagales bacterium]|nr:methylated-DNA--[protein]-cysteine S-methyltransferase [Chitinophagales bacterium]